MILLPEVNGIVIGPHLNIAACQQMNSADEKGIMEPEKIPLFSIQAEIIRLIQTADGQNPCYAAPVNGECGKMECSWRNDCFDEARELLFSSRM